MNDTPVPGRDPWAPLPCPICRSPINLLMHSNTGPDLDPAAAQFVQRYNRLHSGQPVPWRQQLHDTPVLLRRLASEFLSPRGLRLVIRVKMLLMLGCLLYTSPSPRDS
eukprot:TRINITY_DN26646_c0_g1_i3.p1 TRINITY_DN26646_c0_g1~~TRINITY_DN26646_c0_g1_i3.p1  ORF type:complete len:108 (+),score=6.92 TRINITY_DN26646_c0_g1_i3:423-746(+)